MFVMKDRIRQRNHQRRFSLCRFFFLSCLYLTLSSERLLGESQIDIDQSPLNVFKTSRVTETIAGENSSYNSIVSIGPSFTWLSGGWGGGFGVEANYLYRATLELPIYVGVDLGLTFWKRSVDGSALSNDNQDLLLLAGQTAYHKTTGTMMGLKILPTAAYRFSLSGALRKLRPYVGVSIGPTVHFYSRDDGSSLPLSPKIYIETLVRVGVELRWSSKFMVAVEPRFGLLSNKELLLPTVLAAWEV